MKEQKLYVHTRDGEIFEFLCSTGNPKLDKGVATPEGIFVIQNKARKVYSTQFDSTLMLNWLGFNFNIGFHALEGRSYYKFLGKRISSHGCIRISHASSEFLFKNISIGTPVIIHSGKSARVVAFTDHSEDYKNVKGKDFNKLSNKNLHYLYNGIYLVKNQKLVISHQNVSHQGLMIGEEEKIIPQLPAYQNHNNYHIPRRLFSVIE